MIIFFFQAEDGIRDLYVTGVQTCALPIYRHRAADLLRLHAGRRRVGTGPGAGGGRRRQDLTPEGARGGGLRAAAPHRRRRRSEERRVGKECRARWSAEREKKKVRGRG